MKLSEVKMGKKVLVLGAPGTGKTHIIGTLCKFVPTLVVTADADGLQVLQTMGIDTEVILIEDWRKCWNCYSEIATLAPKYRAVAIDDFGLMQESLRHKVEMMPRGWEEEKRQGKDFEVQVKKDLMMGERRMHLDQWGSMWIGLESFITAILKLPFDVKLVTVLEGEAESPRDGHQRIYPNLQGAVRYSLSARFSLVAETFIADHKGKQYYALTCRSHSKIETKSRYDEAGGRTWVNPSMASVLAYINGKGGPETEIEKEIGVGLVAKYRKED